MKMKFDKICSCLQLQGYDGLKEWWELRKKYEVKITSSFVYGKLDEVFYAQQVLEIIIQDGKRIMKDCEKCNQ